MASVGDTQPRMSKVNPQRDNRSWAVEVYKGLAKGNDPAEKQEEERVIDIDEEDAVEASKVMGIMVYYSRKSYNSLFLFADMINAWVLKS
jgi:hypothetical protein